MAVMLFFFGEVDNFSEDYYSLGFILGWYLMFLLCEYLDLKGCKWY